MGALLLATLLAGQAATGLHAAADAHEHDAACPVARVVETQASDVPPVAPAPLAEPAPNRPDRERTVSAVAHLAPVQPPTRAPPAPLLG